MPLNYTPLRHKMLAAVEAGQVQIAADDRLEVFVRQPATIPQMSRALNALMEDACAIRHRHVGEGILACETTVLGRELLDRWLSQYGEPK
jgi:hypothetical protein